MNNKVSISINAITYLMTFIQANEVFQTIELIISAIGTLIILIANIIGLIPKIREWFNNSSKDGIIDNEEIKELSNLIKQEIKEKKEDEQN